MKKIVGLLTLMSFAMSVPVAVLAEEFDSKRIYLGGGLGFNSLPGFGSARGFQFFGGYAFKSKLNEDISSALEIGYMDSGDFDYFNNNTNNNGDATGAWAAAVESVALSRKVDMLVRLGYDFGDDDGLLLGAGMQYKFDTKVALRTEYVAREHVNSLQLNVRVNF